MTHYTSYCVATQILAFAEVIFSFNIWVSCYDLMKFAISRNYALQHVCIIFRHWLFIHSLTNTVIFFTNELLTLQRFL